MNKDLRTSVARALEQGVSRSAVRELVTKAGWTSKEVDEVIETFVESDAPVAIPRREPVRFAKESYLYIMQVISYTTVAVSFLILWFQYINQWLPDGDVIDSGYGYQATAIRELIRVGMSMFIVAMPILLSISWVISKHEHQITDGKQNAVKQGSLYLGSLVASIAAAITLMVTIFAGLNGEATGRFLLKVLAILIVCGVTGYLAWRELRFERNRKTTGRAS